MTEVQNEHDEPIMLPGADKAVASNALLPELAERALEPCADLPRVIEFPDSLLENLRMQRATGFSSLSSSLCAAGSISIVHFLIHL